MENRGSPPLLILLMKAYWRILVILFSWTAACWLIIGGLLRPVLPGGWLTVLVLASLCVAPSLGMVRNLGRSTYPSALRRLCLVRPFWYAQLFMPLLAVSGVLGVAAGLPFGASGMAGRWALGLGASILAGLALAGYAGARRLVVRRLDVRVDDLPAGLEGMRIAQISDLHVGPHTSRRHLARVAAAVREARPDLIAITGDQVDDYARDVEPFADAFRGLSAPLGVFAIPGNHDVYAGWPAVRSGAGGDGDDRAGQPRGAAGAQRDALLGGRHRRSRGPARHARSRRTSSGPSRPCRRGASRSPWRTTRRSGRPWPSAAWS